MGDWSDPIDLTIGDIVVYEGDPEHCKLQQRVIYRVTKKEPTWSAKDPNAWTSKWAFTFEVAFDMFPDSTKEDRYVRDEWHKPWTAIVKHGSRGLRKLDLLTLARMRSDLDSYLRDQALRMGADDDVEN